MVGKKLKHLHAPLTEQLRRAECVPQLPLFLLSLSPEAAWLGPMTRVCVFNAKAENAKESVERHYVGT